jgi:hypothetical protein
MEIRPYRQDREISTGDLVLPLPSPISDRRDRYAGTRKTTESCSDPIGNEGNSWQNSQRYQATSQRYEPAIVQ